MGKYYTVEVLPTIPATIQHAGDAADTHVLFDWTAFDVPKGSSKLLGITALIRGKDGRDSTMADIEFVFAKTQNGVVPITLGDEYATVDTPGWFNNVIGRQYMKYNNNGTLSDFSDGDLEYMNVGTTATLSPSTNAELVLTGESDSGTNVGYDKLYIAAIAKGAFSFTSNVFTTGTVEGDDGSISEIVVDNDSGGSPNAHSVFAIGDVVANEGGITLGTLSKVEAAKLTFESGMTGGDLADSQEIYNLNPIRLILSFER